MNIYQILETLRQVEESVAQIGDRVQCPNNITGTIVSDAGSHWIVIDDHAETEDDTLEFRKSDCRVITDLGEAQASNDPVINRSGYNALTPDSFKEKIDYIDQQLLNPQQRDNWPEFRERRAELLAAAKQAGIWPVKEDTKFAFANPKQRPGDQVRGKEKAPKSKDHPFKGRLVGAMESEEITDEAKATSQRLDPKCWKGYKKQGTKVKGGVRVNNCVPVEEEWEDFVNEYGMTTGGTTTGDAQKATADRAKQVAQVQQSVNKLKNAGANIPSATQATQSLLKDPVNDPVSQLDKNIDAGLGQEVQDIVTKGNPNDVNQLAALIKKINQQSGA